MAVLAYRQRDLTKAEQLYLKALKTYETLFGASHPMVGDALTNVAQFYKGTKQNDKAVKYYQRAVDVYTSQFGAVRVLPPLIVASCFLTFRFAESR